LDSHINNHIFITFVRIIVHFLIFIYYVSITYRIYYFENKRIGTDTQQYTIEK